MPTVLVTLASNGGRPSATSRGKVSRDPPPATVLAMPATRPPATTSSASRRLIDSTRVRSASPSEEGDAVRLQSRAERCRPDLGDGVRRPATVAIFGDDLLRERPQRQLVTDKPAALPGD